MIVVDASAIVEVLAGDAPDPDLVVRVATEELHAPHLIDVEVLHALRVLALRQGLTADRADEANADFKALTVTRYAHEPLTDRIWEHRSNLSAYDATYVALGEGLGLPLVTVDARIKRAPGLGCDVQVYPRSG